MLRKELKEFISACERLMVAHAGAGLTEDEVELVTYSMAELPALLRVPKGIQREHTRAAHSGGPDSLPPDDIANSEALKK
jgi:hypothetical protein